MENLDQEKKDIGSLFKFMENKAKKNDENNKSEISKNKKSRILKKNSEEGDEENSELTEEEKLEEAKKLAKSKLTNDFNLGYSRKLLTELFSKYLIFLLLAFVFVVFCIIAVPGLISFFGSLIPNFFKIFSAR